MPSRNPSTPNSSSVPEHTGHTARRLASGARMALTGVFVNTVLAGVKITAGVLGNSYALIADGIESTLDIFGSLVIWGGLRIAARPPDTSHPYGHGKAETIASITVALTLIGAAIALAVESIREILTPHHTPAAFTLVVLVAVVIAKEFLFRRVIQLGEEISSSAVKADAWHHRSDAITSAAAFVGILIALIGGPGFEPADDWAALLACGLIGWNGVRLLIPALHEAMDIAPPKHLEDEARATAAAVPGVVAIDKCLLRKMGLDLFVDIHAEVDADLTVREGHKIAHRVKDALKHANPSIVDVLVHIEPATESTSSAIDPAKSEEGRVETAETQRRRKNIEGRY